MAAAYVSESLCESTVLRASGIALGRADVHAPLLEDVRLTLSRGECVLLRGATGSGKSTLLRMLAGLRGVQLRAGSLERPEHVPLLLQHIETQLLCTTVAEEVRLGLHRRGLSSDQVAERARDALSQVGLEALANREVDRLSSGQKQRVAIAALLALDPEVLLLDEPCAALDATARKRLADVLAKRKARGTALLIAEHAPRELLGVVDRCLDIEAGRLREGALPREPSATADPREARERGTLTSIAAGERVLLTGPNGSGKSSQLRALARDAPRSQHVALVIQEPRRGLFARSVRDEIEFSMKRRRVPSRERAARVRELLQRFDLVRFADRSPRRLSFGQQHSLAVAAALASRPGLVLLDEPFAGLDAQARTALLRVLQDEHAESGASFVLASHDREPIAAWCDRVVVASQLEPSHV